MAPNRRLKQARELRGWSQARVAEKIGTDATTVSRWERGLFSPTPYFREKLCKLFDQNAEELGLMESADLSGGYERSDPFLSLPTPIPLFQANGEWQKEAEYAESAASFLPPSWTKRTDTFSYILRSAMHDQQAHMLWGDAYVRALQGQRAEAQQLGEASLNAFERVGHLNATAVREWLNQRELIPPTPPPASRPPRPSALLPEQPKQPTRRFLTGKRAGIILMLLLVVSLAFAELVVNQSGPTALASPPVASVSPTTQTTALAQSPAKPAKTPISTPASSAAINAVTRPSALNVQISPSSLAPQDCFLESLGYRCTLNFWLSTPDNQGNIPWHASSADLSAQFNPLAGTGSPGAQVQVIVYVKSSAGQKGQLIFTFTFASQEYTQSVSWQG